MRKISRFAVLSIVWLAFTAAAAAQSALIDLGWIRASQAQDGWLVERVSILSTGPYKLEVGDLVYSVDGKRLDALNPLSAAVELEWVFAGAHQASVLRNGVPRNLTLRYIDNSLAGQLNAQIHPNVRPYKRNERFAKLQVPDASGKDTVFRPGPGITLIHVWSAS